MKAPAPPRRLLLSALFVLAASLAPRPSLAQPVGFLLEGNWFRTGPTGTVQLTGTYTPGPGIPGITLSSAVDVESDLGYGKRSSYPFGVRFIGKRFRFEGEYFNLKDSADVTLTRDIVYQGIVYRASEPVSSDYAFRDISGHARFDLVSGAYGSVGIGADVDVVRYSASITATARGLTGADSRDVVVPTATVGFNVHDAARHLWLDVKAGYISYQGSNAKKGRVELGYGISEKVGVKAGWRTLDATYVKTRDNLPDDRIELKLEGYYAGLYISF